MIRIVGSFLVAAGLFLGVSGLASAEVDLPPSQIAYEKCLAAQDAAFKAAPALIPTSNPRVFEVNFDKYILDNIVDLQCSVARHLQQASGETLQAQIAYHEGRAAAQQALVAHYEGLALFFGEVRCFRYFGEAGGTDGYISCGPGAGYLVGIV